jgi:hypothetical protein
MPAVATSVARDEILYRETILYVLELALHRSIRCPIIGFSR